MERPTPFEHGFESLEDRVMPAVTASFLVASGTLSVLGDTLDNHIEISRNAAGALLVNGGAVAVTGGTPTVVNTALIQVLGLGGNDTIALNEASGALPAAILFGGTGDDTITGGSGGDQLFGQSGNDTLLGKGGFDFLFGGTENDTLTGGDADDQVLGESGNDRMIWNPGDDTDLNEGGDGTDTTEVNGGGGAENFILSANNARVRFDRLDPAPFSIDIGTTEKFVLNANGGNDTFTATGNLEVLINVTVDGGTGDDTILGSNGNDLLRGGDGNDFVDAQQGDDVAELGAGDDVFQWDAGEGNDVVEGQGDADRLLFNGSSGPESFAASANSGRVKFTRDVGNIVTDLNDVERIDLNAFGGTDTVTVNNMAGTDLTAMNVNLSGVIGGNTGDGELDTVVVNGTSAANIIDIVGAGDSYAVLGLTAQVLVTNSDATDGLVVNALGGNDSVTATALPAGTVKLKIDGGAGNDTILGSQGDDILIGGLGRDFVLGDNGNDLAQLGGSDDVFQWDPGDGNDTVQGQAGIDVLRFNGSGNPETLDLFANGAGARLFRDVASVTTDLDGVERLDLNVVGGADVVNIGNLSGTGVTQVNVNLEIAPGLGDGAADRVVVTGTGVADTIGVTTISGAVRVNGLAARVNVTGAEAANDTLSINALDGNDVVTASTLPAGMVKLQVNGGLGADTITGSPGDDVVNGGDGDDLVSLGAGNDTFVWNPGDDNDTVDGQAGFDTLLFNGSAINEQFDISANAGRVRLFRDIASVTADLNQVERIDLNTLGGPDAVVVNDLSGTGVTQVNINLAGTLGGISGDAQADTVTVVGTGNSDVVLVTGSGGSASVLGLDAQVNITAAEPANDRLVINTLGGDDTVEASGLGLTVLQLTADGGDGDDVLVGSEGADTLKGGLGDDVLIGGLGLDILDGGPGSNTVIQ
jgi:Ca2+-binding RTX toxin-like protein